MVGDLHCHTTLSDGSMALPDVIAYAKQRGLTHLAITDHDTMAGVEQAVALGKQYGVQVIPGVEISTQDNTRGGRMVHLLCYFPQDTTRILQLCAQTTESRTVSTEQMLRNTQAYYPLTAEHAHYYGSGSVSFYKVHIMRALMDLGFTDRIYGDVYRQLFHPKTGSCFVHHDYPDVLQVLDLIAQSGGISVLAHPQAYDTMDLFEELAAQHKIDGVEVYHPKNTPEGMQRMLDVAGQQNLIVTGGTDFHGMYTTKPYPLGSFVTQQQSIERLLELHRQRSR